MDLVTKYELNILRIFLSFFNLCIGAIRTWILWNKSRKLYSLFNVWSFAWKIRYSFKLTNEEFFSFSVVGAMRTHISWNESSEVAVENTISNGLHHVEGRLQNNNNKKMSQIKIHFLKIFLVFLLCIFQLLLNDRSFNAW